MELLHCDARHARWFQIRHLFILPPCICFHPIFFFKNKANHKGFDKPSHQTAQSPDAQEKNANETLDQRTGMPAFFSLGCIVNKKEEPLCL